MQKKIVSLLLVACMLLAMLPALALNMFAAEETYVTSFGPDSDNFPSIVEGAVVMPDAWKVGSIPVTTTANGTSFNPIVFKTGFTPFNLVENSGTYGICDANKNAWGSNNGMGGGFGIGNGGTSYKNTLLMGVNYGSGDANLRTINNVQALPAVRYIAEYAGTVSFDFDIGYYAPNGTYLTVLHNGEVIATYEYGVTAGVMADIAVMMGDTIDFVSTPDLDYDYDSYAAAGYDAFDYQMGKRGLVINELTVAYATGYYVPDIGMGEVNADIVHNLSTSASDLNRYFVAWYDANGNRVSVASGLTDTCYAVINPYLMSEETANILATDTYKQAVEKYRAWLKTTSKIVYNGNWSIGEHFEGAYGEYLYPSFLDQANPYMVRKTSAGTPIVKEMASSRWMTERQFDKMFDSWYAAGTQGTTTNNKTIPNANTKVADIKITYSADLIPTGSQGNGMAYAPTTVGAAGGLEGQCFTNEVNAFYTRPGNKDTSVKGMMAGAVAYTAPATGILTFKVHAVNFVSSNRATTENLATQFAIYIDGVQKTTWKEIDNKNGNNPADAINAALANIGEIVIYEGQIVEFAFLRDLANNGTHVSMTAEAFLDTTRLPVVYKSGDNVLAQFIGKKGDALPVLEGYDNFGSSGYMVNGVYTTELPATVEEGLLIEDFFINTSASIAISGDFLLNVYVDGAETATAAGIVVNGIVFPGVKQANGKYKVELAAINAGDLLDAEYTYYAYQYHNDGSYRLSKKATTVNTGEMLDAYVDGETDTATKNMADAIRDYAYMAKLYFTNGTLESNASIKNELKGPFTILNGQNGSNHTNYDSGLYDVMLATLKKYSVEGYVPAYTNTNYKDPVTGQLDTFVDAPNIFPANKVEWGFGDQNPTDAAFKYAINGVTLNLAENVGFAIKIAANGANDIAALADGFQVKVTVGNGVVHYYDAFVYVDETKSEVAVVVDGVPAGFFDQDYTFTVVDANGNAVSATYTYSVLAWIVNEYQFGNGSVKMYLVRALYRMGLMAEEYIHG